MSYTLKLTANAIEDIEYLKKAGDKATLRKLGVLLEELTSAGRTEIQFYRMLVQENKFQTSAGLPDRGRTASRDYPLCQRAL